MNKLIYYETQLDKYKMNLVELTKLRSEILADRLSGLSFLDSVYLDNVLKRVNEYIKFLLDSNNA